MQINQLSGAVIGAAMKVHTALGSGLLEKAYQQCLAHELSRRGFSVVVESPLPVFYEGLTVEQAYRLDLIVENQIIVEVKAVAQLLDVHRFQLLTQLKFSGLPLGLLINFHAEHLRDGIKRVINGAR